MKKLAKKFPSYDIAITAIQPEIVEENGVESKVYKAVVTITTFENVGEQSRITRKVQAMGFGKTQRLAERDGIKEALHRIGV